MARAKSDLITFARRLKIFKDKDLCRHLADLILGRNITVTPKVFIDPLDDMILNDHMGMLAAKYRRLAVEGLGYNFPDRPIAWRLYAGFEFKVHAPQVGPCYGKKSPLDYLRSWKFDDTPTKDCILFGAPCIVPWSTGKTSQEQLALLAELRRRFDLPDHHLSGFGSVQENAMLILRHFSLTGEQTPLERFWIRTNTCRAGDYRICLGYFDSSGLSCDCWYFDWEQFSDVGVFALGVEALGS